MTKNKIYNFITPWGNTEKISLIKENYADGTLAVRAVCENGEPWATLTVNLSEYGIKPSNSECSYIKDYSENEGTAAFLISNKIAAPTGRVFSNGWVEFEEFKFDLAKF